MHREYQPHAWHEPSSSSSSRHVWLQEKGLLAFTLLLGGLIVLDLATTYTNWGIPRGVLGISWGWMAATLAAVRACYAVLEGLLQGRIGADLALAQACLAAIVLREPLVAAEVIFISELGNLLEAVAASRAYRALGQLFEQIPRTARVERDGQFLELPMEQVQVGDRVEVAPGERVPVDGVVLEGVSSVDQSSLTGESMPVDVVPGQSVFTGSVNQFGRLVCSTQKVGKESTLGQVVELVRKAQARRAPIQRAADRYARYFLPIVEGTALLTLLAGWLLGWPDVWRRVVSILVVACPCALVLATPAAVLASMAWLARRGVVLKGGVALEKLAACHTLAFDKTGTLTAGKPSFSSLITADGWTEDSLLELAAGAERGSRHPLAAAVVAEADRKLLTVRNCQNVSLLPGLGLAAEVEDARGAWQKLFLGSPTAVAERLGVLPPTFQEAVERADRNGETPILVMVAEQVVGLIGVRDRTRPEAHDVVHELKHLGMTEIALLTGDRAATAARVAKSVHLKLVESELRPADKAAWIEARQAQGQKVAMVGDGINDAPALAQADVGIAIAGPGSDLAAEAGDIVLMGSPLAILPDLVGISRSTLAIIRQNILGFAFGVNGLAMAAAALGWLGPIAAALLHQAASLFVLLNSLRLLGYGVWGATGRERLMERVEHEVDHLDDWLSPVPLLAWLKQHRLGVFSALMLLGLGFLASRGFAVVRPGEVALVSRLGQYRGMLGPGPHLLLPPPLETVETVAVAASRRAELGVRTIRTCDAAIPVTAIRDEAASVVMTGDEQFVRLSAVAQYQIRPDAASILQFAFQTADPEHAVEVLLESAVREVASRSSQPQWLGANRIELESKVALQLQKAANAAGLGIDVSLVAFQETGPPFAVLAAYRDVSRAENEQEARANSAKTYSLVREEKARSAALVRTEGAGVEAEIARTRALGEANAFSKLLSARTGQEKLSDARRFWDRVDAMLRDRKKLILDDDGTHGRKHLVLPGTQNEMNRWIDQAWRWMGGSQ